MLQPYKCIPCGNIKRGVVYFFPETQKNPKCPECEEELSKLLIIHLMLEQKGRPPMVKVACGLDPKKIQKERPGKKLHLCGVDSAATCHDCLKAVEYPLGDTKIPTRQPAVLHPVES